MRTAKGPLLVLCPNWHDARRKQCPFSMMPIQALSQHPLQSLGVQPNTRVTTGSYDVPELDRKHLVIVMKGRPHPPKGVA